MATILHLTKSWSAWKSAEYQHFIVHKLAGLDNVGHAQSSFVLTELKYETAVPIDQG